MPGAQVLLNPRLFLARCMAAGLCALALAPTAARAGGPKYMAGVSFFDPAAMGPCPAHGRCAQAEMLATQAATATSTLDGTVTFAPASLPGVATNMLGLAVTGNSGSVNIAVAQHP